VDAILIGATTRRRDNPLLVNSPHRRAVRAARGLPEYPIKDTVTANGDLDPTLKFWHHGGQKLVFIIDEAVDRVRGTLCNLADVVSTGPILDQGTTLDELGDRGVTRLMVEGGGTLHTQFMARDLADELRLVIAPLLVGQADAPVPALGGLSRIMKNTQEAPETAERGGYRVHRSYWSSN
jgi:riboflavin biosynthesis pyrimidine reductase